MKFKGLFFLLTWPEEISNNELSNLVKMLKASKAGGQNLIRLSANFITWLRISPTQTYQRVRYCTGENYTLVSQPRASPTQGEKPRPPVVYIKTQLGYWNVQIFLFCNSCLFCTLSFNFPSTLLIKNCWELCMLL